MNQILMPRPNSETGLISDDSFESFSSRPRSFKMNITSESYCWNIFLGIFFYLLWGILFIVFASNENFLSLECENIALIDWAKALGISNIVCCVISIFLIPALIFYINKKTRNSTVYSYYDTVDNGMKIALKMIKILRILLILTFAIFYIAAIVVYSFEYNCNQLKHLNTLMFSFIVMCSVFVGVFIVMILIYLYNAYHKRVQSQELKFKYIQ